MVHSNILQVYEELSTPFEKFGIQGSGTSFKDIILNLFDGTVPRRSVIGKMKIPDTAPRRIHNSILGSTTTEKGRWDEMFSSSNDDTLRQRMNIIPSTETRTVDIIRKPDFTEFRKLVLERIGLLNSYKMVWSYSPEARKMLKCRWIVLVDKANLRKFGYDYRAKALANMQREGLVAVETNPADKNDQKKWIVLWTGFGLDKDAVWTEKRGGRRSNSGRHKKE
jgi:hypothetical protein